MSAQVIVTIGLETHVQLKSRTKIFCSCAAEFGSTPNSNVCPVCLGLPGSLPVLNRKVFSLGLRAVLALGGTPSEVIKFDRKNYFYPDLPKGYQISQFDHPLGRGGFVEIDTPTGVKQVVLNRLHLEEDAGKLIHDNSPTESHVDLNRAGTPLAEIVTEPCLDSSEEAYEYLTNLKAILKTAGVSDCDMEKGHLRCDANVSIRKNAADPLGKRVEIKNLNSFKAVKAAIEYEVKRQAEALEKGEVMVQETRLWDDTRQKTFTMRSKEDAHDYRYFPEPDLVPFHLEVSEIEEARKSLPTLPRARKENLMAKYNLSEYDARLICADQEIENFFEDCVKIYNDVKTIAIWIKGSVFAYRAENSDEFKKFGLSRLKPQLLVQLIGLVDAGTLSLQVAKEKVFPEIVRGFSPAQVVKEKGLTQVSDTGALEGWIVEVIAANPKVVEDFKSGKESAVMFLVGQVMKKSQGKANPGMLGELIKKKLKEI